MPGPNWVCEMVAPFREASLRLASTSLYDGVLRLAEDNAANVQMQAIRQVPPEKLTFFTLSFVCAYTKEVEDASQDFHCWPVEAFRLITALVPPPCCRINPAFAKHTRAECGVLVCWR
jgi:hypothetical protein